MLPRSSDQDTASVDSSQVVEESRAKFHPDGSARRYPGITIICHLRGDGPQRNVYDAIMQQFYEPPARAFVEKYRQLPKASLHMTVFDAGVYVNKKDAPARSDSERSKARDADAVEFGKAFRELKTELQKSLPVKMRIDLDESRLPVNGRMILVPLEPYDEQEAETLIAIRQRFRHAFGQPPSVLRPDYKFHITIYYPLEALSKDELAPLLDDWRQSIKSISLAAPKIEIDRFEFCTLEDMLHFEVLQSVSPSDDIGLSN